MKSRSQKKNLSRSRQSQRRKIQSGGMKVEDAIKLLTSYGCGVMEASAATSIMTKGGKVDDAIFHGAVFLHNKYDKTWKDAALLSLASKGNLDAIKLIAKKEEETDSRFKTTKEPNPKAWNAWMPPKLAAARRFTPSPPSKKKK